MGNYVSLHPRRAARGHARSAKVILPCGRVQRIDGPANAAELMLDAPGHFLVDSRSMHAGRRFAALAADEDLEMGHVYAMFPMKRVNAVVAAADMAALLMAARKEVRRELGAGARVLPDAAHVSTEVAEGYAPDSDQNAARTSLEEAAEMREFRYRLSMCRSRRPTLETIAEEPICSR